ncbi:hypothetical protein [Paenibacillus eucommiae]|uniref:Neutral/alkaline non-lysosomal ceramidase N-terminal domain-containing protein n=1 Tax=Paenibacillus eucommiae TaxID=1355755 RepID=A0ABS4IT52_9BACL|nr:hypothetical protein [Paenibacillus eucommiae]MBP1990743.1 hypothetical protein [Paenibacillus eucommiae]
MRFGAAKDLITPDRKTFMGGYASFFNNPFVGIHDDLFVRALLMDDGKAPLLFISVDLLFHDFKLTRKVQEYAKSRYELSADHLFLAYSHTHGGPAVEGYDDVSQHSPEYEEFLLSRIFSCIDRVMVNCFEGSLEYGSVSGDWNINRRLFVDGAVENMPNPQGLKDDRLHVLRVNDQSGKARVILFNYACHPVTVRDTPYLSGDFPGRVCHLLEAEYFGAMGIFFQGSGGNSRPKVTTKGGEFITCTYDEVDEMAAAITLGIKRLCRTSGALVPVQLDLAALQFAVKLELDPFPKPRVAEAASDANGFPGLRQVAARVLHNYEDMKAQISLPGGMARLSESLYIAYMGGEPCYEVKLKLEQLFPGVTLLFFGYADSTAYIPDDSIIAEGGYEADGSALEYGLKGSIKQGTDEVMAQAYKQAFEELRLAGEA